MFYSFESITVQFLNINTIYSLNITICYDCSLCQNTETGPLLAKIRSRVIDSSHPLPMTVEDGEGVVKNARWEIELEKNIFEGDNPITVTTNQTYAPGFSRKFGITATIGTCRVTGVMELQSNRSVQEMKASLFRFN